MQGSCCPPARQDAFASAARMTADSVCSRVGSLAAASARSTEGALSGGCAGRSAVGAGERAAALGVELDAAAGVAPMAGAPSLAAVGAAAGAVCSGGVAVIGAGGGATSRTQAPAKTNTAPQEYLTSSSYNARGSDSMPSNRNGSLLLSRRYESCCEVLASTRRVAKSFHTPLGSQTRARRRSARARLQPS